MPPNCRSEDQIVSALRESSTPIFAPLSTLPDETTRVRLRAEFPRVLFVAPRPPDRTEALGDEVKPDPALERELEEYESWQGALNSISNN